MPSPINRDVPIRQGLMSQQTAVAKKAFGVLFPSVEGPLPGQGEETVIFESLYSSYRMQINSPLIRIDLATSSKTKERNEAICFENGKYIPAGPKRESNIKFIMESKAFGAPFRSNVWLRSDRQKLDVERAVVALTEQLLDRPDLVATVSRRLKELSNAGPKFTLPTPPVAEGEAAATL